MGKKKSKGFQDPLSSIFGVLFEESKKKPVKTRPPKYTGKSSSDAFTRQLAEIATKPSMYLNDAAIAQLNSALGQNFFEMYADKGFGPDEGDPSASRFRVRTADLSKVLSNPKKFFDSAFNANADQRKLAAYIQFARGADSAMTSYWAWRNGMKGKDALDIGLGAGNFVGLDMHNSAEKRLVQNAAMGFLAADKSKSSTVLNILDNAKTGDFSRNNLQKLFEKSGQFSAAESQNLANEIFSRLSGDGSGLTTGSGAPVNRDNAGLYARGSKEFVGTGPAKIQQGELQKYDPGRYYTGGRINIFGYREITAENLLNRARLIDPATATTPEQRSKMAAEKEALVKSASLLSLFQRAHSSYADKDAEGMAKSSDQYLKKLSAQIENLRTTGGDPAFISQLERYEAKLSSQLNEKQGIFRRGLSKLPNTYQTQDFAKLKKALETEIECEITKTEKAIRDLGAHPNPDQLAELELNLMKFKAQRQGIKTMPLNNLRFELSNLNGKIGAFNSLILKGGIGKEFLTGGLWTNPDLGSFSPVDFDTTTSVEIAWGRTAKVLTPRSDITQFYSTLTNLYYLTPGAIAASFVSGDIPAKVLYEMRKGMVRKLTDPKVLQILDREGLLAGVLSSFVDPTTGKLKVSENNVKDLSKILELIGAGKGKYAGWARAASLNNKVWSYVTAIGATPSWLVQQFNKNITNKGIYKWGRKNMNDFLLKFFKDQHWADTVTQFMNKTIGLRQLIGVAVDKILTGLGVSVGGPIGGAIAMVISEFITDVAYKVGKIGVELLFMAAIGAAFLFLAFIFFVGGFWHPTMRIGATYSDVTPGSAKRCVSENPDAGLYPQPPEEGGGEYPPSDSDCPVKTYICTQGHGSDSSQYHQRTKAFDIGTRGTESIWYAPTNGKVTRATERADQIMACADGSNYGGWVDFVDSDGNMYRILHVKPLVGTGPVKKGTAVALAQTDLQPGFCWTGPHFHLEVTSKGMYQDAETWYRDKLKCPITPCP